MQEQDLEIDNFKLFYRGVLDALSANIAVLDSKGTIVMVNDAWCKFGSENDLQDEQFSVGTNYLNVCDAAGLDLEARTASSGIRSVLLGGIADFIFEYSCDSPWEKRRFRFRASSIKGFKHFAVVSHERIDELAHAATEHQTTLTVCAWCTALKIDLNGKDYWYHPATGVSGPELSHGICPTCNEKFSKD